MYIIHLYFSSATSITFKVYIPRTVLNQSPVHFLNCFYCIWSFYPPYCFCIVHLYFSRTAFLYFFLYFPKSSRKYFYYRTPIGDPSETDNSDRRPIVDRHAPSETNMPYQRPTCSIGYRHARLENHKRPTCPIGDRHVCGDHRKPTCLRNPFGI